jgi:hypothetical protein
MADKIYPVTKDGVTFEVRAASPEEAKSKAMATDIATVARIINRAGDTRVFERPNGQRYVVSPGFSSTEPAAVEKALAGMAGSAISRGSMQESMLQQYPMTSKAVEYVRGIPSAGSRLDEAMGAAFGPQAEAGVRALSGAMQEQRPKETMALNLLGGVTATAPLALLKPIQALGSTIVGQGPRIVQAGRAALAGMGLGAAEGGIYGSGEGTTPQERLSNAATGAKFGGAVGGLLGFAGPYVEAGVKNVVSAFQSNDIGTIATTFGISANAARVIKNTFEMGGDIQAAIQRLMKAGDDGMVADAGEAGQALLDAVAASGPTASAAARGPIDQRMVDTAQRLDTGLTGLLGMPAEGPVTAVGEIMSRTATQRSDLYGKAYQTPIDYSSPAGQNIESIIRKRIDPDILMTAIREANAEMADNDMVNQQIMAQIGPDGFVKFVEMPNVQQLDELKKALDQIARDSKKTEGVVSVDTTQSRRYARQAQAIRDAVVEATGGPQGTYAQALKVGGDTIQERKAFELGDRILSPNTRVEDVMLELGKTPSNAQLEAARRGLRTRIDQVVGDVKRIPSDPNLDARQALATLREMGSDNAREKIKRIMGSQADEIFRLLDEAGVAAETRAAMAVNSRTAVRQATQEDIAQMTAPGVAGQALRGEPVNTTKKLIQAVTGYTDEFTVQQRQRVYQDLAKALTQRRGPDAVAALRVLDVAMQGQKLTDAQTEMLAKLVSSALISGTAPSAGRETAQQFGEQ